MATAAPTVYNVGAVTLCYTHVRASFIGNTTPNTILADAVLGVRVRWPNL